MTGEVRCFEPRRSLWPIPAPKTLPLSNLKRGVGLRSHHSPRTTLDPTASSTQDEKEEVDSRSIYVGNVDYACKPGEVQQHFQVCGTVNRVTILTDKLGRPKGFAYVEFFERESVKNALLLNESELLGRKLKVSAKRTNVPGMNQFRGGRFNPYAGFRPRRAFVPGAPVIPPFGYIYLSKRHHGTFFKTLHHSTCNAFRGPFLYWKYVPKSAVSRLTLPLNEVGFWVSRKARACVMTLHHNTSNAFRGRLFVLVKGSKVQTVHPLQAILVNFKLDCSLP
uniref:RRM domain-containing protein n=1 Tax=Solanum lycopersicum TaxID=4081 RepID=A0A3Q7FLU8_SOLLC